MFQGMKSMTLRDSMRSLTAMTSSQDRDPAT
jgi:hypothetical protein